MAVPILQPVDFSQNEAQNLRVHNLASPPSSPVEGQLFFDSTGGDKTVYFWDGTAWVAMKSGVPADNTITSAKIVNDAILNEDVNSAAGIVYTKLNLSASIVNADVNSSAAIAYSKLNLGTSIVNADVAAGAAIAYSKLNLATSIVNADIAAGAAIVLSKLAVDPLARANHTGSQTASTVSDFDTQVRTSTLNQMTAPTTSLSLNSQKITNLLTPTADSDAANKSYVDAAAAGIDWKGSVRVATTANGTLATAYENGDTVDGVVLATGDRILIKDQSTGAENGLYVVAASGAPARSSDANVSAEVTAGLAVFVAEGTANADSAWVLTTNDAITLDTTALVFTQFSGLGQVTAGGGIGKTGNTLSVAAGTGLTQDTDGLSINTASTALKFAQDVGDGAATSYTITHSLGTKDVHVTVFENASTFREVMVETQHTSTSVVTLVFAVAPASAAYRVVVSLI